MPKETITMMNTCLLSMCILASGLSSKLARAGQVLYDGSTVPADQGWSVDENIDGPLDISTDGNTLTLNTIGVPAAGPSGRMLFHLDVGAEVAFGFTATIRLKVSVASAHNPFDTAVAFLASYGGNFGTNTDRSQMVFFDEDLIGWGDESDVFTMNTTAAFHDYDFSVAPNGVAVLSVDGTPVLAKSGFQTNGVFAFGDQTNDAALDARFQVDHITFGPFLGCVLDAQCGNGDVCTGIEVCDAGNCVDGTPVDCGSFDDVCAISTCDPLTGECGQDVIVLAGSPCRVAGGECDPAELCDGVNATCPDDVCGSSGFTCDFRGSEGVCDGECRCRGNPVPTVGEWGMAILLLSLVAAGVVVIRRHQTSRAT